MNFAKNRTSTTGHTILDKVVQVLSAEYDTFVLGSCWEEECNIVFASDGFSKLTEFGKEQIVGEACSCNFLFGPDTRPEHILRVQSAVSNRAQLKASLVLYRKSSSAFIGAVEIQPILSENGSAALLAVSLRLIADFPNQAHFLLPTQQSPLGKSWNRQVKRLTKRLSRTRQDVPVDGGKPPVTPPEKDKKNKAVDDFSCPVIHHNGTFKIMWDWLLMVATFYVGIVTPYNAVFSTDGMYLQPENITGDIIVEILFISDIFINFGTTYHDSFGHLVTDRKAIARHYLWTWFFMDLLAAIPFDALYFLTNYQHRMIVMLKCVRLLRLARLFSILERYSQYSSVILVINMTLYVLLAHWFACIWYMIGSEEYEHGETDWNVGWMYRLNRILSGYYTLNKPSMELDDGQRYWSSLYFSMTMLTSVGFGNESANTVPEKIAVCIAMPVFALMHAVVFGNVTAIIQRMYARRFSYDIQANELKDFYRIYNVPKPLKRKIREFYQTVWTVRRGINHEKIVQDFPEDLKADVSMHIYSDFLNHSIFRDSPRGCLKALGLEIKTNFVNPGEFVVHSGDVPQYFYYVKNGSLEVLHNGKLTGVVDKYEVFGPDISQSYGSSAKSGVDVKSVSDCDIHCLPLSALINILSLYPEFGVVFSERLPNELSLNILAEDENSAPAESSLEVANDTSSSASNSSAAPVSFHNSSPVPPGHFLTVPHIPGGAKTARPSSSLETLRISELHQSLGKVQRNVELLTRQLQEITVTLQAIYSSPVLRNEKKSLPQQSVTSTAEELGRSGSLSIQV